MTGTVQSDVLIIGGGLAGLVTALECLRAGQRVTLVDRDMPERLGGLSLWAFGGMALVDTPLQRRMKLKDSPDIALRDWIRFGELGEQDVLPRQWARYYVEHSRGEVYDWLLQEGVKFMPAVNWVERGRHGDGNSLPRYHIVWGTSRELTRRMIAALRAADSGGRLTVLHGHRVSALDHSGGQLAGKGVLLLDLCLAPAFGPVELGDDGAVPVVGVFEMNLVDTVLIGTQRREAAVALQSHARQRIHHDVGRERRIGAVETACRERKRPDT